MSPRFSSADIAFREKMRAFMDETFIRSDISEEAYRFIRNVHGTFCSKPRAGLLYAPTDYGKSSIIDYYIRKFDQEFREAHEDYETKPILKRKIKKGETARSLIDGLLTDLDDPAPSKGTSQEKYHRLSTLSAQRRLTFVIFDDFTRLLKGSGTRANEEVAYLIQSLLDDVFKVPILLTGVDKSKDMVKNLKEFDRRVPFKHAMRKYGCSTPLQCHSFRLFIQHLQSAIPLKTDDLTTDVMLKRMFYATNGVPGAIKTLIEMAILMRPDIEAKLTLDDLYNAFNAIHEISSVDDKYIAPSKSKLKVNPEIYVPEFNPFNKKIASVHLNKHLDWPAT